jgi:transketolase
LREGNDITILAAGTMVYNSLKAAELLYEKGISTKVINMHTIKPLDKEAVTKASETTKLLVTVEEHSIIGGLGSAVSEHLVTLNNSPRLEIIGLQDEYGHAGSYKDLLENRGLTEQQIAKKIEKSFIGKQYS